MVHSKFYSFYATLRFCCSPIYAPRFFGHAEQRNMNRAGHLHWVLSAQDTATCTSRSQTSLVAASLCVAFPFSRALLTDKIVDMDMEAANGTAEVSENTTVAGAPPVMCSLNVKIPETFPRLHILRSYPWRFLCTIVEQQAQYRGHEEYLHLGSMTFAGTVMRKKEDVFDTMEVTMSQNLWYKDNGRVRRNAGGYKVCVLRIKRRFCSLYETNKPHGDQHLMESFDLLPCDSPYSACS